MSDPNIIPFFAADAAFTLEYAAVKMTANTDEVALCNAASDICIGFTTRKPSAAGDRIPVIPRGLLMVIAQGAILKGEAFVASATVPGAVTAATGAAGERLLGVAVDALADTEQGYGLVEAGAALTKNTLVLTVNAEVTNVITVDLQTGVAAVGSYEAQLVDANAIESLAAAFTLAETGVGAEVSATAQARLLFTTDAAGAAQLSITDVVTASGATIYLMVRPLNGNADGAYSAITFD